MSAIGKFHSGLSFILVSSPKEIIRVAPACSIILSPWGPVQLPYKMAAYHTWSTQLVQPGAWGGLQPTKRQCRGWWFMGGPTRSSECYPTRLPQRQMESHLEQLGWSDASYTCREDTGVVGWKPWFFLGKRGFQKISIVANRSFLEEMTATFQEVMRFHYKWRQNIWNSIRFL